MNASKLKDKFADIENALRMNQANPEKTVLACVVAIRLLAQDIEALSKAQNTRDYINDILNGRRP